VAAATTRVIWSSSSSSGRMPGQIHTTLYTDSACPWAYSEIPALRVIDWRYGDQLDWRLVMIGLTESVFDGRAERVALGDDAAWLAPERADWFRGVLREAERAGSPAALGATA
jgi:hypothetical protein